MEQMQIFRPYKDVLVHVCASALCLLPSNQDFGGTASYLWDYSFDFVKLALKRLCQHPNSTVFGILRLVSEAPNQVIPHYFKEKAVKSKIQ